MSEPSSNFVGSSTNVPSSSTASDTPAAPTAGADPTPTTTFIPPPSASTFRSAPSSDSFDFNVSTGPQVRFRPIASLPRKSLASRVAGNAASSAPPAPQSLSDQPVGQASSVPIGQGLVTPLASSLPPPFNHTAEFDKLKEEYEKVCFQLIEKDQIIDTHKMLRSHFEKQLKRAEEERDSEKEALSKGVREELEERFAREKEALAKQIQDQQKERFTRELESLERGLTEQTRMLSFELQKKEDECTALKKKAADDKQRFKSEHDALAQRLEQMTSTLEELRLEKADLTKERDDKARLHLEEMTTLLNEQRTKEQEYTALLASKVEWEKHAKALEATRESRSERESELEEENAKLRIKVAITESDKEMAEEEAKRHDGECVRLQNKARHLAQQVELLGVENATLVKALEAEREANDVDPWVWLETVPLPQGVPWLWFIAFLLVVLLGFVLVLPALFWAMGWFEQLGAFGYGGPDFDSAFSRLVAITLIYSQEFLSI